MNGRERILEQEFRKARAFFSKHRQGCGEAFAKSLEIYRAARDRTYIQMDEMGIVKACSACAGRKPAGCCFKGVEEWYDAPSLLINMFMGVHVHMKREVENGCLFVGSKGCKLIVRHSFCVNYLCPEIMASLTRAEKTILASVSGEEILLGWDVEKSIRDRLTGFQQDPLEGQR